LSLIEQMLALQETDRRIRELERLKSDIPARQESEKKRLEQHKADLNTAEELQKQRQASSRELDVEVQARHQRILKLRTQQMEIKTNREFRAIEDEIAAINAEISGIEDRELVLMQDIEDARSGVAASRGKLEREESAVRADISEWDARIRTIEGDLAELRRKRAGQTAGIDAERLSTYEAIFSRRDLALVPVVDGVCSGCHMNVPRYVVHDARKQAEMVRCTYCGRLLY